MVLVTHASVKLWYLSGTSLSRVGEWQTSTRTSVNMEVVKSQRVDNCRVMCKMIDENTGIPKSVMQQILKQNLQKRKRVLISFYTN